MIGRSILLQLFAVVTLLHRTSNAFLPTININVHHTHRTSNIIPSPILSIHNVNVNMKESQLHTTSLVASSTDVQLSEINPIKAFFTKAGMIAFVASMCVALPITLLPPFLLHKSKLISTQRKEKASLRTGQFCSRWLMRFIPFANIKVVTDAHDKDPEPSIWVCNHTSMLDIFFLLATDKKLRGRNKRPIKIIYWKALEKNPVTGLLFKMCGFISVEMEDNGSGNANQYKTSSFKILLKGIKQAFEEGWDIGILPEGQLNPCPEDGLQPVFAGAFTMARMSKRPIRMLGLHGLHKLWHGDESIGMTVTGREVKVRAYPFGRKFDNADEFVESFKNVVGHFGAKGYDHPDWKKWIDGTAYTEWKEKMTNKKDDSNNSNEGSDLII